MFHLLLQNLEPEKIGTSWSQAYNYILLLRPQIIWLCFFCLLVYRGITEISIYRPYNDFYYGLTQL